MRLWEINHSGPGNSFYEFYQWYTFQQNTRVYIIKCIYLEIPTATGGHYLHVRTVSTCVTKKVEAKTKDDKLIRVQKRTMKTMKKRKDRIDKT